MARFDLDTYVTVQERILAFYEDYPDGIITSEPIPYPGADFNNIVVRANVYKKRPEGDTEYVLPDATGLASEVRNTDNRNLPNFASWWENCETSAIGRALANMGYATVEARPSREEMEKVERYEQMPVTATTQAPMALAAPSARPLQQRVQQRSAGVPPQPMGQTARSREPIAITDPDAPASDKQIEFLMTLAGERGYGPDELGDIANLTKGEASSMINQFKAMPKLDEN